MRKSVPKGWISITEFESLTGINKKTITAAISRGAIPARYVSQVGELAKSPYYINPQQAATFWHKELNPKHASQKRLHTTLSAYIKTFNPDLVKRTPKSKTSSAITAANAADREQIAKAEMTELKLHQMRGELVSKADIDMQLYNKGKLLREAILAVPDKITDQVCAYADDRNKVRLTIENALTDALRSLAEQITL